MTLPAFRDKPECPKCSSKEIEFSYQKAREESDDDHRPTGHCGWTSPDHFGEHHHLKCGRCGFGATMPWIMAVAEKASRVGFQPRDSWQADDSTAVAER